MTTRRLPVWALSMAIAMACASDDDGDQFGSGPNPTASSGSSGDSSDGDSSDGSGSGSSGGEASCGNGVIDAGEECDGDDLGEETCTSLGYSSGELTCDAETCMYDSSMCTGSGTGGGTSG